MIWINGKWVPVELALELLALAREIERTEHISRRDALRKARKLLPQLERDARKETRYRPARIVLFTRDGQPQPANVGVNWTH